MSPSVIAGVSLVVSLLGSAAWGLVLFNLSTLNSRVANIENHLMGGK